MNREMQNKVAPTFLDPTKRIIANGKKDLRTRRYLGIQRILLAERVEGSEKLLKNNVLQSYLCRDGEACILSPGSSLLVDFGFELTGAVRIVSGRNWGKLRLRFGESVSEACAEPNGDHAIHDWQLNLPAYGSNEFGNTGFRFVRLDLDAAAEQDFELLGLFAVSMLREYEWVGAFESSDELLNRIWKTGVYTVQLNCQDYLYDGVKRDRLVWQGDLHPEIRTFLNAFDDTAIVSESLELVREQSPLPEFANGLSSYSLWWIICNAELFFRRGDRKYLARQLPYLKDLLKLFTRYIGSDGLEQLPEMRFFDWPSNANPSAIHNGLQALMVWAFAAAERLGVAAGDAELANFAAPYTARMRGAKVQPLMHKSSSALLALTGLSPAETIDREILGVDADRDLSTFLGGYVMEARAMAGHHADALETIRRYWGGMLELGATTFWEDFQLDWMKNASRIDEFPVPGKVDVHAAYGDYCYQGYRHSFCHGWASGATWFLSECLTGMKILEPGCKKVAFRPVTGGLKNFCCKLPTPYGAITVEAEQNGKYNISAPEEIQVVTL